MRPREKWWWSCRIVECKLRVCLGWWVVFCRRAQLLRSQHLHTSRRE